MAPMLRILALLALFLSGCVPPKTAGAGPSSIYVMRHLHKAAGADPGLSEEGRAYAQALAIWFARDPPKAIYVSDTRRARETAAPLAAKLGLTPKAYNPTDAAGLASAVANEAGTVLIIGHSNTVPGIIARLGGTSPAQIAEDSFGDIWHIARPGGSTARHRLQPGR